MVLAMRTTIRIDDELYREMKERAVRTGRTIGELVEDAVRRSLITESGGAGKPQPELPVYGGSGVLPGVDLTNNAALWDLIDGDETVDALR
jgi:hypothetical protein